MVESAAKGRGAVETPGSADLSHPLAGNDIWQTILSRPSLDARARATVSITALILRGAAGRKQLVATICKTIEAGLMTIDEVLELILHMTGYAGYPAARRAYLAAVEAMTPGRAAEEKE